MLKDDKKEWKGHLRLEFSFVREHSIKVRYDCQLKHIAFRYYVPKALLESYTRSEWPDKIRATFLKSDLPKQKIGFHGKLISPRTENDFWEYDYNDKKSQKLVNYHYYDVDFEGQRYEMYMPNEVFKDYICPNRMLVYIWIPE